MFQTLFFAEAVYSAYGSVPTRSFFTGYFDLQPHVVC